MGKFGDVYKYSVKGMSVPDPEDMVFIGMDDDFVYFTTLAIYGRWTTGDAFSFNNIIRRLNIKDFFKWYEKAT